MSLLGLHQRGIADVTRAAKDDEIPSTTLAFAFDSGYLEPFKVLLHSMARAQTLVDCPIVIHTDDPLLNQDNVVAAVADEVRVIEPELQKRLHDLAKNTISRKGRADWDRGTFLKWSVFRKCATAQALFLDVDMICLRALEPLVSSASEADFIACPQFQAQLRKNKHRKTRPPEKLREGADRMLAAQFDKIHRERINSGVMLLRNAVLSADFFDAAARHAEDRQAVNEQRHLSSFFQECDYRLELVSSAYNFHEAFLNSLAPNDVAEVLKQVTILHYAGPHRKPWKKRVSGESDTTALLWYGFAADAHMNTELFG